MCGTSQPPLPSPSPAWFSQWLREAKSEFQLGAFQALFVVCFAPGGRQGSHPPCGWLHFLMDMSRRLSSRTSPSPLHFPPSIPILTIGPRTIRFRPLKATHGVVLLSVLTRRPNA